MKELKFLELRDDVTMQEVISYSKLNNSPVITILDDLNYGLFNEMCAIVDTLKIPIFIIKDTYKIAVIGNRAIALKMAKKLQVKAQVMFNAPLKQKKILGKMHTPKRESPYVVQAYNEDGKPTTPFVDTDIESVECNILSQYKFTPFKYAMKIRGAGNNKIESYETLKEIRHNFILTGKV